MNYGLIYKVLGFLNMILSVALIIPWGVAKFYGEEHSAKAFLFSTILSLLSGVLLTNVKPKDKHFRFRESVMVVSMGWVVFSLFGAIPYVLGTSLTFVDSIFETMSGLTTTGASVMKDIEAMPKSILFWRALTHWIGGMGIIVLSLAILPLLGASGASLFKAEAPGPTNDKLMPKLQETAKLLWYVYVGITALQIIMLKFAGMGWFDSVCHTFATVATGGFSTKNNSLAYWDSSMIQWIHIVFMFIAGANFTLHFRLITGNPGGYLKDREFRFYFWIFMLASTIIGANLLLSTNLGIEKSFRDAAFQVISILTTTGYVSADYSMWAPFSQAILLLLMFIGGCGGSTGGGVKVIRIMILIRVGWGELRKILHPNAVFHLRVWILVLHYRPHYRVSETLVLVLD
jgi:trk system potassium uptake protein TrkH